jgi:RNase H-like protein
MPKILILDIEWKPAVAYVWKAWDENVGVEQVINPGGLLSFAAKWVGDKKAQFYSGWTHTHEEMVLAAHKLLDEADAVVTYNGDKYDLPKLQGEFLLEGLKPPAPVTSIDVIKAIKKLGFFMNRLAFVGPLLGVGDKIKHEGFELWAKVLEGDRDARKRMRLYNIQDVELLEALYEKIKPFIKNHPHLGLNKQECGACGSLHTQRRGFRRTKFFKVQRIQCTDCGSWSEGTRTKIQ